jgi:hypothetical protein
MLRLFISQSGMRWTRINCDVLTSGVKSILESVSQQKKCPGLETAEAEILRSRYIVEKTVVVGGTVWALNCQVFTRRDLCPACCSLRKFIAEKKEKQVIAEHFGPHLARKSAGYA